jgi:hypothetical protein
MKTCEYYMLVSRRWIRKQYQKKLYQKWLNRNSPRLIEEIKMIENYIYCISYNLGCET